MYESKFIVLDGPDGCGKSTQAALLAEFIASKGFQTLRFRDPGSTKVGEKIRQILLDVENEKMTDRTELLLYMAARAQLYSECIGPGLDEGKCVILDRWISSTCAYQGYAGGLGLEKVFDIAEHSLERVWPDLTLILDVDTQVSARRMNRQLDRMEQKPGDYHSKVRRGFLALAEARNDVIAVDAGGSIDQVSGIIKNELEKFF